MKIIDVFWTKNGNRMIIKCGCGMMMEKRMNRWYPTCTWCGRSEHIDKLRNDFVKKGCVDDNVQKSADC